MRVNRFKHVFGQKFLSYIIKFHKIIMRRRGNKERSLIKVVNDKSYFQDTYAHKRYGETSPQLENKKEKECL